MMTMVMMMSGIMVTGSVSVISMMMTGSMIRKESYAEMLDSG